MMLIAGNAVSSFPSISVPVIGVKNSPCRCMNA